MTGVAFSAAYRPFPGRRPPALRFAGQPWRVPRDTRGASGSDLITPGFEGIARVLSCLPVIRATFGGRVDAANLSSYALLISGAIPAQGSIDVGDALGFLNLTLLISVTSWLSRDQA